LTWPELCGGMGPGDPRAQRSRGPLRGAATADEPRASSLLRWWKRDGRIRPTNAARTQAIREFFRLLEYSCPTTVQTWSSSFAESKRSPCWRTPGAPDAHCSFCGSRSHHLGIPKTLKLQVRAIFHPISEGNTGLYLRQKSILWIILEHKEMSILSNLKQFSQKKNPFWWCSFLHSHILNLKFSFYHSNIFSSSFKRHMKDLECHSPFPHLWISFLKGL
jgi:hypothetical protein